MGTNPERSAANRTTVGGVDVERGAAAGAVAFLVGYALTWVLYVVESGDGLSLVGDEAEATGELGLSAFDLVGWLFYNAHFVDVGTSVLGLSIWVNFLTGSLSGTLGALADSLDSSTVGESATQGFTGVANTVPLVVWLAVPAVVLLVTGYLLARRDDVTDLRMGARTGASVAVGYLALAVAGTFLFTGTFDIGPQLSGAVILMGLGYPVALGGLGGAIAATLGGRSDSQLATRTDRQ